MYDGFDSSRGPLGRRLIRWIAKRRASESQEQVRRIAARINESELLQGFDKLLNPQLVAVNQKWNLAHYVNLFMGEAPVRLAAKSSKECICIGVGQEGSAARPITDLPRRDSAAPVEVWVHRTILGEPVAKIVEVLGNAILPQPLQSKILAALAINAAETANIRDIAVHDDWFVLGLQNVAAASLQTATTQHTGSDSTKLLDSSRVVTPCAQRP